MPEYVRMSLHDIVLTIDGKIQKALAVLGENRRRNIVGSFPPSPVCQLSVEIAVKTIESMAEKMMELNEKLMNQMETNEDDGQIILCRKRPMTTERGTMRALVTVITESEEDKNRRRFVSPTKWNMGKQPESNHICLLATCPTSTKITFF